MPIQIIMTEGLISKKTAQQMHIDVGEAFLDINGLNGNTFMTPNIIGEVLFVEKGLTFANLHVTDIAIIELRVPSFALSTQEQKNQFVSRVTDIVKKATDGKLENEKIWVNAVYAVDGMWGIGGKAYTIEELGKAIGEAAKTQAC